MICDECAYDKRSHDDLPCCICHFADKGIPKMDDSISRTEAIQVMMDEDIDHVQGKSGREVIQILMDLPFVQCKKEYTKADYLMNLHKQYGCNFTRAEEAHQKALEYLQDMAMMG